jgi:hypothetical protein
MTETGTGGGHECVQDVWEGGAGGRGEGLEDGGGQEAGTGRITLSVRVTVRKLEDGIVKPRMGRGIYRY